LFGKSEGRRPPGGPMRIWEDNIRMVKAKGKVVRVLN
jgi:hypothetical protein